MVATKTQEFSIHRGWENGGERGSTEQSALLLRCNRCPPRGLWGTGGLSRLLKNWGKGRRVRFWRKIGVLEYGSGACSGLLEPAQAAAPINRGSLMRS